MTGFAVLPFLVFCFVSAGTPGPNNMINLSQGVRLGFRGALPYAIGTGVGIGCLLFAVALGLGAAFAALPWLFTVMRIGTLVFLVYLAWKIATAGPPKASGETRRLGAVAGFLFQWINPKTWASVLTMATTYLPAAPSVELAAIAGVIYCLSCYVTQPVWIGFGTALRGFLADQLRAAIFNGFMAALLLVTTVPVLLGRG